MARLLPFEHATYTLGGMGAVLKSAKERTLLRCGGTAAHRSIFTLETHVTTASCSAPSAGRVDDPGVGLGLANSKTS